MCIYQSPTWRTAVVVRKIISIFETNVRLKPLAGGPGLPGLKCTSAAAPT